MVGAKEALVVMYHGLAGVEFQEALLKPFECSRYAAAVFLFLFYVLKKKRTRTRSRYAAAVFCFCFMCVCARTLEAKKCLYIFACTLRAHLCLCVHLFACAFFPRALKAKTTYTQKCVF